MPLGGASALVLLSATGRRGWVLYDPVPILSILLPSLILIVLVYRLLCAYRLYLKFDHAFATVLASQVMVLLLYWKVLLMAEGF
ncbi:MAG TPA: hypothetical protein VFB66_32410 [Tepidisphaeraceae bacterium]|nr:hypothetical protein [Tepidisphaeraceae bacterium]